MPSISVVICAYNEEAWLGRTLQSLLQQSRQADEIIVVNNASTDGTPEVIDRFAASHPDHCIRRVDQPLKGLHHAREAGWRAAQGDILVMTDADITFPADWLRNIENAFQDLSIDALTSSVRYQDAPAFINWVTWITDQLYQPERIGRFITKSYCLNGGNSAYRRSVLEAVNGYTGKPANLLEDRHMSKKIQDAGYRIRFDRTNNVWHTFRRYQKDGWRGYLNYIFFYEPEHIYADHLADG